MINRLSKSWLWFRSGWLQESLVWPTSEPWVDCCVESIVSDLPLRCFLLILISFPGSSSSGSFLEGPDYLTSIPSGLNAISRCKLKYTSSRLSGNVLYQWEKIPWFCFIHALSKKACDTGPHALMIHKVNHKCIDKGTLPFSIQWELIIPERNRSSKLCRT